MKQLTHALFIYVLQWSRMKSHQHGRFTHSTLDVAMIFTWPARLLTGILLCQEQYESRGRPQVYHYLMQVQSSRLSGLLYCTRLHCYSITPLYEYSFDNKLF